MIRLSTLVLFLALVPQQSKALSIAIAGCSQSTTAWAGWANDDTRPWDWNGLGYGGGNIAEWHRELHFQPGQPRHFWDRFDQNMAESQPADIIWFQVCVNNHSPVTLSQLGKVMREFKEKIPGVEIYLSPLADWVDPSGCTKLDILSSNLLVDAAVASGRVLRGPDLPVVQPDWPINDCHVGPVGRTAFGRALKGWSGWPSEALEAD